MFWIKIIIASIALTALLIWSNAPDKADHPQWIDHESDTDI